MNNDLISGSKLLESIHNVIPKSAVEERKDS